MSLHVVKPGMLTTVQDLGRWGYQNLGVPVAGPMDHASHRLANLLVGNRSTAATLEVTWLGPELEFEQAVACALTGAEFDLMLDGRTVARNAVWQAARGSRLTIGARRRGARAYLAVKGGIAVPRYLGSRATHVASRMGGLHGRALEAGDRLPIGSDVTPITQRAAARSRRPVVALPDGGARVRVMLGPQDHVFSEAAIETLRTARFSITPQSNRMGYRLTGPSLEASWHGDMPSDATPLGAIQVPASGEPILLMADGQTTGGYPKVATVITADLAVAGQLAPGDWLEFQVCGREAALTALIAQERMLME